MGGTDVVRAGSFLCDGRYRVRKEINRGGTAVVYEAEDIEFGGKVALKVMNNRDGVMAMPVKAVKREIEYASSISHDNIVKLIDVFAERQSLVIVWELVQGADLLDLLNEHGGRMSERRAFRYFAQLLNGVLFLHSNGFCHRDLKPENCMVDKGTHILKIIDFGLSKHLDSAVTLGVGTPDYMAPELINGGDAINKMGAYDPRATDVWAMGVILYLMVSGCYPFENPAHPDNVSYTLANVRDGKFRALPSDVSAECADLIACMLKKRVPKRISLTSIAKHTWMRQQMDELMKSGKSLPGRVSLKDMVRKDEASAGAFGLGRKNSTVAMSGGDIRAGKEKGGSFKGLSPSLRAKVSPRNPQSPSAAHHIASAPDDKTATSSAAAAAKESFRFSKLNIFGGRSRSST